MNMLDLKRLEEWLLHGKSQLPPTYKPDDVATEMAPVDAVLLAGLDSTHLAPGSAQIAAGSVTLAMQANVNSGTVFYRKTAAAGAPEVQTLATLKTDLGLTGTNSGQQAVRFKVFDGVDGSGATPDLNCTLTGAAVGDKVAGIINSATFADAAADFESTITVVDKIQQVSLADLSGNTYLIVLYTP
jgi:hypothetical protein